MSQKMDEDALGFLDAPSDLVPGVYEGGLKTWECSLDLAECLHRSIGGDPGDNLKGRRILEVRSRQIGVLLLISNRFPAGLRNGHSFPLRLTSTILSPTVGDRERTRRDVICAARLQCTRTPASDPAEHSSRLV